ncbi:MAG: hypothetical protein U0804_06160 [Gemmataceae bacterium]
MQRMLRTAAATAVLVVLVGSAGGQGPAAPDLFPTKVGAKWTYKINDQDVTVTVSGTEKVGDKDGFKFDTAVGGQVKQSEVYYVTADGVYRAKVGDKKVEPAVQILKLPAKKDAAWDVDSKVGSEGLKGKFKVTDEKAKVKVGGADVEAVLVEAVDFDVAQTKIAIKQWFAPGKGVVKVEYTIQGTTTTMELKDYAEAKK